MQPQPALPLQIRSRSIDPGLYSLELDGEIDIATSIKLREELYQAIDRGSYNLLIKLDAVRYIDTSGLGVLIGARKRVREHNGHLWIVCQNPRLLRIFNITSLSAVFDICTTEEEVLQRAANVA